MEERKLKPATIATKLAHLSVLCRVIDKPQLLSNREQLFRDFDRLERSLAARSDKSIEAAGLAFMSIYERACALNPRVACQLALCWEFGLRVQESWCFRPHQAVRNGLVHVLWGTKGGRRRVLGAPLIEEQRVLIELAKTFVTTEAESMVPRGCSLARWKAIFYRVVRRIGLTCRS